MSFSHKKAVSHVNQKYDFYFYSNIKNSLFKGYFSWLKFFFPIVDNQNYYFLSLKKKNFKQKKQ